LISKAQQLENGTKSAKLSTAFHSQTCFLIKVMVKTTKKLSFLSSLVYISHSVALRRHVPISSRQMVSSHTSTRLISILPFESINTASIFIRNNGPNSRFSFGEEKNLKNS
jgi:hypothetical protein